MPCAPKRPRVPGKRPWARRARRPPELLHLFGVPRLRRRQLPLQLRHLALGHRGGGAQLLLVTQQRRVPAADGMACSREHAVSGQASRPAVSVQRPCRPARKAVTQVTHVCAQRVGCTYISCRVSSSVRTASTSPLSTDVTSSSVAARSASTAACAASSCCSSAAWAADSADSSRLSWSSATA